MYVSISEGRRIVAAGRVASQEARQSSAVLGRSSLSSTGCIFITSSSRLRTPGVSASAFTPVSIALRSMGSMGKSSKAAEPGNESGFMALAWAIREEDGDERLD